MIGQDIGPSVRTIEYSLVKSLRRILSRPLSDHNPNPAHELVIHDPPRT